MCSLYKSRSLSFSRNHFHLAVIELVIYLLAAATKKKKLWPLFAFFMGFGCALLW